MSGAFRAKNQIAIVGFAHSQVVRRPSEPLGLTALKTARAAIADAGLTVDQIDGFTSSALMPSSGGHEATDGVSIVTSNWLAQHLGARPAYVAGFSGLGQLSASLALAINALSSGAADYVLVHRALHSPQGKYNDNPMTRVAGDMQWTAPQGFFGALPAIAMVANEYLQRYGAPREALGHVAVEARKNGARIPWSYWHGKPLSLDEYLASDPLYEPMGRFDADIPVEGVGCFVLTTADRARDLPNRPVYVSGLAAGYPLRHRLPLHWTLDEMEEGGDAVARRLWASTGMGPKDIDLPQLYDAFSPFIFIWLEALGFVPRGEGWRFVMDGNIDSDRPGALAVLSGGGAIGNGRLHGLPQLTECYLQLAGRAGERQRDVATAMMAYSSPDMGGGNIVFTNQV